PDYQCQLRAAIPQPTFSLDALLTPDVALRRFDAEPHFSADSGQSLSSNELCALLFSLLPCLLASPSPSMRRRPLRPTALLRPAPPRPSPAAIRTSRP